MYRKVGRIFVSVLLGTIIIAGAMIGCAQSGSSSNPNDVLIASIWPMTGANARFGTVSQNGVDLAIEEINRLGGIHSLGGAKLKAITGDARTDPAEALAEAERILGSYPVSAMVGLQASSLTLSAARATENYGIPLVTYSLSDKLVTSGYRYVFQVAPTATEWGEAPVRLMKEISDTAGWPSGTPRAAIAYEDSAYGSATARGLRNTLKEIGWKVVVYEAYRAGFTDASPLVLKLKLSAPDFLFLASYLTDAILIQKTIKATNFNIVVIGTGVGHSMEEFGRSLGSVADYVFCGEFTHNDLRFFGLSYLSEVYKTRYDLTMSPQALGGYELVWVVKEALELAGSRDPEAVREALTKLDIQKGPAAWQMSGRVKFDERGHNIYARTGLLQWRNGKLSSVWPSDVAARPLVFPIPKWSERK